MYYVSSLSGGVASAVATDLADLKERINRTLNSVYVTADLR